MADFSTFRSALNGFNRTDVTNYIEALCEEHRTALHQAQSDTETVRGECASLREKLDEAEQEKAALTEQLESMQALLDAATAPQPEPEEALPQEDQEPTETPDYLQLELESYRRAEATERLAAERAKKLRRKLSELLDLTSNRYEEAAQEIRVLTSDLNANLQRLDETLAELDSVFDSAVEGFDTLREAQESFSD